MTRLEEWPERLSALVDARLRWPFAWGTHDCWQFAAAGVEAITGEHPLPDWVGVYDSAFSASTALDQFGGTLETLCEQLFGPPIAPGYAGRGDVVLFDQAVQRDTLGICLGPQLVGPGELALVFLPRKAILKAWKIG